MLIVPDALQLYAPYFRHLLVDLSAWSDQEIRCESWLQVCMLMMRHIYDNDLGKRLPGIVKLFWELSNEESVMDMLQTVLLYAPEVSRAVSEEDLRQGVRAVVTPERRAAMEMTLAQKWMEQGREEGREEGKAIAQRQTLIRLLAKRFPDVIEQDKKFTAYFAIICEPKIERLKVSSALHIISLVVRSVSVNMLGAKCGAKAECQLDQPMLSDSHEKQGSDCNHSSTPAPARSYPD